MVLRIKNKHKIRKKDIKKIESEIQKKFSINLLNDNEIVEVGEIEGEKYIFFNNKPCFMFYGKNIFFTLFGIEKYRPKENFVTVDMGAVRFVTNGADVMSPGIIDAFNEIKEGDQVWICDEMHHKPLAIGIALTDGITMVKEKKGKSVKLIHYVGDKIWNFFT